MAGDAYKGLWNFGEGPEDAFSNAVTSYEDFLKVGSPAYRAEAELACLFAKKAELSSDPGEKTAYEDKQALSSVKAYKAPRMAGEEKAAFVKNNAKGSSDPCAAVLASLWESRNPDQDYSAMLAAVGN